jgi:hypothetical protein
LSEVFGNKVSLSLHFVGNTIVRSTGVVTTAQPRPRGVREPWPKRNRKTTGERNPNIRGEDTGTTTSTDRCESSVEVAFKGVAIVLVHGPIGTIFSGPRWGCDAECNGEYGIAFLKFHRGSGDTNDGGGDECYEEFSGDKHRC